MLLALTVLATPADARAQAEPGPTLLPSPRIPSRRFSRPAVPLPAAPSCAAFWSRAGARRPPAPTAGAAFNFLAQAGTVWMAYKTNALLDSARRRQQLVEDAVTAELPPKRDRGRGVGGPARRKRARRGNTPSGGTARSEQMEDWVALTVFIVLYGGADAYVAAHLADFPVPLTVEPVAGPSGTAFEVGVSLPWTPGL